MPSAEHYDVIIIGTGAGGGTLAHRLAPSGARILLLERGTWVPREKENWDSHAVVVENRYHVREFSPTELDVVMREAFDEIWLYGIHGSKAMNEIERGRVARARKLARLDPLGLRYHLPESIDTKLRRALRRRPSAAVSGEPRELAVEDMRHTRDDTADSLDLLAVGRV